MESMMGKSFLSKSFLGGSGKGLMGRLTGRRSNSIDETPAKIADENV
jgi:hypothetical protein